MVGCCGVVTVGVAGCSSTEQESARIGREARQLSAAPGALTLGATNRAVRVSDVTLLSSAGRTAVAAKLTNISSRPQANLPLALTVTGKDSKVLYSNSVTGLEASLQHLGVLRAHQSAWWVDDQVLTSQPASRAKLRVGTGSSHAHSARATLATSVVKVSQQSGLSVLGASVTNHSATAQGNVAVFAVAFRGGRVEAAGRAVVAALGAHASTSVQVFLVGDPAGAKIELGAVPAAG